MKKQKWMTYGAALLVTASLLGGCAMEEEETETTPPATAFSQEVADASEGWLYLNQSVFESLPGFSNTFYFGGFPDAETMVFYNDTVQGRTTPVYARINEMEDTMILVTESIVMTIMDVDMAKNRVKVKLQERI